MGDGAWGRARQRLCLPRGAGEEGSTCHRLYLYSCCINGDAAALKLCRNLGRGRIFAQLLEDSLLSPARGSVLKLYTGSLCLPLPARRGCAAGAEE